MLLIILFPFLGFLGGSLFSRYLGYSVCYITTLLTFLSFVFSSYVLNLIINTGDIFIIKLFPWIKINSLDVTWSFCFDSLTSVMLVVVTLISTLVHLYSTEYMKNDPHLFRFMSYLSLFTFFMLFLVTANTLLQLFVG
jgi:NADH-quinone oxidoreductase subunit L